MIYAIKVGIEAFSVPPRPTINTSTVSFVTFVVIYVFGAELFSVVVFQTVAYS